MKAKPFFRGRTVISNIAKAPRRRARRLSSHEVKVVVLLGKLYEFVINGAQTLCLWLCVVGCVLLVVCLWLCFVGCVCAFVVVL